MKIFLLSPNADTIFTASQKQRLGKAGDLVLEKKIIPLGEVRGLMTGDEDRILAIDPDFCDWKVPNEVIGKVPNLRAVVLQTTSFSWIDVDYLGRKGIPVVNLRGFSSVAVAEWAVMIAMNLARRIPLVVRDGWRQDFRKHQGIELRGRTAGIIGLGSIGTTIAENCQGLGMKVQYWSRSSKDDRFKRVSLAALMKSSDLIFPAVAQNRQTQGLITDKILKRMKKSAIFVSVVHHVYNHGLLLDLARKGKIHGYGFETSRPEFGQHEGNVWAGPELAWWTKDSMRKNAEQWTEAIVDAGQGEYPTKVNETWSVNG